LGNDRTEAAGINDADLQAGNFPLNTVTLPESGFGNDPPQSAGATLVVVYRDPSEPLRKILVNEGIYIQPQGATTTQTLQGFYKSAPTPSAKLTYIAGTGAKNPYERISFNGSVLATNPFPDSKSSSDRGWANPTFDVSSLMSRDTNSLDYGETATTTLAG